MGAHLDTLGTDGMTESLTPTIHGRRMHGRGSYEMKSGHTATVEGMSYWADAAFLAHAGIPIVLYGPAGDGAHAHTEWVDLDSVTTCTNTLTDLAITFPHSQSRLAANLPETGHPAAPDRDVHRP